MAPRPPIEHVVKVEVLWTQSAVHAANILHCGYTSSPPAASDLASLASAVHLSLKAHMQAWYTPDTICTEVICTDLSSDTGNVGSDGTGWAGTSEGDPLSAGSAVLVNWQQARRYRGGKPRTYWPAGPSSILETASSLTSDAITVITNSMNALNYAVDGQEFGALITTVLGCVSYTDGKAPRVAPVWEPFTGFSVGTLIRTQRRRITASSF